MSWLHLIETHVIEKIVIDKNMSSERSPKSPIIITIEIMSIKKLRKLRVKDALLCDQFSLSMMIW
jgi:hypothetical protein